MAGCRERSVQRLAASILRAAPLVDLRGSLGDAEVVFAAARRLDETAPRLPSAAYMIALAEAMHELHRSNAESAEAVEALFAIAARAGRASYLTFSRADGRSWTVRCTAALSDIATRVWPASLGLVDAVAELASSFPALLVGKHVLELGAGTGLAGVALCRGGMSAAPAAYTLTDGSEESIAFMAESWGINPPRSGELVQAGIERLSWGEDASSLRRASVFLGSDLAYDPAIIDDLTLTLAIALAQEHDAEHGTGAPATVEAALVSLSEASAAGQLPRWALLVTSRRSTATYEVLMASFGRRGLVYLPLPPPRDPLALAPQLGELEAGLVLSCM
jgi:hypothetical protein